jgi:hypothetical protein
MLQSGSKLPNGSKEEERKKKRGISDLSTVVLSIHKVSLIMYAVDNGNVFSAIHYRLEINCVIINTPPQITVNGSPFLEKLHLLNEELPSLATTCTDDPPIGQLAYRTCA